MSVDLFGGGIFGFFLHVLEVILLDVSLVEFDKSGGPLFFVQFVDNSENLATHFGVKTLLVVEFDAELAILLFEDLVEFIDFLDFLVKLKGFLFFLFKLFVEFGNLMFESFNGGLHGYEEPSGLSSSEREDILNFLEFSNLMFLLEYDVILLLNYLVFGL
jgi:hypothetical protein